MKQPEVSVCGCIDEIYKLNKCKATQMEGNRLEIKGIEYNKLFELLIKVSIKRRYPINVGIEPILLCEFCQRMPE